MCSAGAFAARRLPRNAPAAVLPTIETMAYHAVCSDTHAKCVGATSAHDHGRSAMLIHSAHWIGISTTWACGRLPVVWGLPGPDCALDQGLWGPSSAATPAGGAGGGDRSPGCDCNGCNRYLRAQKQQYAIIWAAYRRRQGRIMASVIGEGVPAAISLYRKVKALVPAIAGIGTDANSCYAVACAQEGVPAPHVVSKAQTHVLESANSRIRDNLARLNRRSKRYSKSWQRLDVTLRLFFQYHHSNK